MAVTWRRADARVGSHNVKQEWRKPQDYDSWVDYHEERHPVKRKPELQTTANRGFEHLKKRR